MTTSTDLHESSSTGHLGEPAPSGDRRLLAADGPDLPCHAARFGPPPRPDRPHELIGQLVEAGLRGRGGAGFPTGSKMGAVTGRRPVVIANGAEGEPASSKDTVLLEHAPHLVLDGLALAAAAVGAREAHLYTSADVMPAVRRAVAERRTAGWDRLPVQLTEAPDTFIAGEKSAVVNAIEGRPAIPRDHLTSLTRSGLRGRPTLVHNVETLAHVALIARYGPNWFRGVGNQAEPGTMLVTLSCTAAPGVVEVPTGTALTRLLRDHTGIDPADVRALLLGGYHGTWITGTDAAHAELSRESLSPLGSTPGAGVVQVLRSGECGLRRSADIVAYLADQSARQCGPCLNGLPALANILTDLAYRRPGPDSAREITRLTALVDRRGACNHPDGTARFLRSTMLTFCRDVELHLRGTCETAFPEREPRNPVALP